MRNALIFKRCCKVLLVAVIALVAVYAFAFDIGPIPPEPGSPNYDAEFVEWQQESDAFWEQQEAVAAIDGIQADLQLLMVGCAFLAGFILRGIFTPKRTAALLLIALIPASASAQHPQLPTHAIARIACGPGVDGMGMSSLGSGILLDTTANREGLVVTNNHVVEEHTSGPFRVTFSDGSRHRAVLLGRNPQYDLAALKIQEVDRKAAPWTNAIKGEKFFYSAGYGGNSKLCFKWGNYTGHHGRNAYFSMPIIGGDSGGPVFDEAGCVCGICWGGDNGQDPKFQGYYDDTVAVHPAYLAKFLSQWNLKPTPVEQQYVIENGCPGGNCQPYIIERGPRYIQPRQPDGGIYVPDPIAPEPDPIAEDEPKEDAQGWRSVIEDRIVALEKRAPVPGPAGPQGERGEPGPTGPQGPAGADGATDEATAALIAELQVQIQALAVAQSESVHLERIQQLEQQIEALKKLPITFVHRENGREISRVDKHLGGTVILDFTKGTPVDVRPQP